MDEQKLIVIIVHPEFSKYHATFKLARELLKKGYRVVYLVNFLYKQYLEIQGFEYKVIESDVGFVEKIKSIQETELQRYGQLRKLKKSRLRIRMQNELEMQIAEHVLTKVEDWLKKNPPVLVLFGQGGEFSHFSVPVLKRHIPILGLDTNLATPFRLKTPPAFSGIIPKSKTGWTGYIRNFFAWSNIYGKHFRLKVYRFFRLLYGFGIFSCNKSCSLSKDIKKYGGKIQWWGYGTTRLKVPGIVLCPIEFDFPFVTETADRCYGGTGVDTARLQMPFNWGTIDGKKPLVYCSIGSHPDYCSDRIRLYRAVIESLKDRPHLQGIIQVWDKQERNSLNPLPRNVITIEKVPQLEILSRALLFITHGGLASVREGIFCGVPMIVFPWGVEQPGNSARVMYHHLGLRGDIRNVTGKTIGRLIDKICNDSSYHQSVKQMQKIFREQENCEKGIGFIESMIAASAAKRPRAQRVQHRAAAEERGGFGI